LAAGIYGVRSGLETLVLEKKMAGGTTADAPSIENYPGFQRISGQKLAQKMIRHSKSVGVEIRELEEVVELELKGREKIVETDKGEYEAEALIFASGAYYRKLDVPGEERFHGRGVSYCGVCDGPLFRNRRLLVVGGGNSAVITALYLAGLASEIKLCHRRGMLRAEEALIKALEQQKNVEILWNTELKEIKGENAVDRVVVFDNRTDGRREIRVEGVFVQVGEVPNSQIAEKAGVKTNEEGYIIVDMRQRTNASGIYAAGDVTNHPVKQIGTAVGQGITAALEAYGYIRQPYYYKG
jgi:thioredoxin reductase (NADPH)